MVKTIGIIGERRGNFRPHEMLEQSLEWLREIHHFDYQWIDTETVDHDINSLRHLSGIWSAPGSPFNSLNGAVAAIKYAREYDIPHLGTCAGFQHMIIEFARNILGLKEAQHEEYDSSSGVLFISKLACSLAGQSMSVAIKEKTVTHRAYQKTESTEDYYCQFGLNPEFQHQLIHQDLVVSGVDQEDEIRIIEYPKNRFFVVTLFVPQSRSTKENIHPLIVKLVEESCR